MFETYFDPPEPLCEMCGCSPSDCVCPECPECGLVGDPACYEDHGLQETAEQRESRNARDPGIYEEPYEHPYWEF